jgi:hypothetical protein
VPAKGRHIKAAARGFAALSYLELCFILFIFLLIIF